MIKRQSIESKMKTQLRSNNLRKVVDYYHARKEALEKKENTPKPEPAPEQPVEVKKEVEVPDIEEVPDMGAYFKDNAFYK